MMTKALAFATWIALGAVATATAAEKPNIIVILVDDMGFSDIGCYGGEIDTPNIDRLGRDGVRFTQFYNSARCCPTRASLMTGLHPHEAGIGHMTLEPGAESADYSESSPFPGYQGFLNRNCMTIAEVLGGAGYATLMTGKWHLGYDNEKKIGSGQSPWHWNGGSPVSYNATVCGARM